MKYRETSIIEKVFTRSLVVYFLHNFTWSVGVLVDGAVIGNFLGVDAVAAYGLVWPLTMAFVLVGSILSGGSRNLYTKLAGQGLVQEANHVFTLASLLPFSLSLVLAGLAYLTAASGKYTVRPARLRAANYFAYISEYFSVTSEGSSKCWKSFRSVQSPPHSKPFSRKSV